MHATAAERVLRDLPGEPEASVEIEDGTEHFRGGAIRLAVRGDGATEVEHRRSGERERYAAQLPPARLAEIGERLADLGLLTLRAPDRPLVPGETLVELTVRRGGETLHSARIPSDERYESDGLDGILGLYEDLVSEITGGTLPPRAAVA